MEKMGSKVQSPKLYNVPVKLTDRVGLWGHWWKEDDTGGGTSIEILHA